MAKGFHWEMRVPIPFTDGAVHVEVDGALKKFSLQLGPRSWNMSIGYMCPDCKSRMFFHSNKGAALLWCQEHGLKAIQHMADGSLNNRCQMNEEQYEKFVEDR